MKYAAALVAALAAAGASAQDISIFPQCSLECIVNGIGTTSCEVTDFVCVCKNIEAIKQAATPCVLEKCGIDVALNEVLPATEKFCADVGTGGGSSSSSSEGTTAAPSTTEAPPTTTEAPPTTATTSSGDEEETSTSTGDDGGEEETSTGSAPGSIVTPPPSGSAIPSTTESESVPAAPTSSVITAGAASAAAGYLGGLGMLALGAVAAF